jgi:spoIIIJ-associated protein
MEYGRDEEALRIDHYVFYAGDIADAKETADAGQAEGPDDNGASEVTDADLEESDADDSDISAPEAAEAAESAEESEESGEKPRRKRQRRRKKKPQPSDEAVEAGEEQAEEPVKKPAVPAEPAPDRTEEINAFLTGLMEKLEVDARPVIALKEDNIYAVELVGENLGGLIGRRGETLDAIQQLTNYAVNNGQTQRVRIHIDAENYRAKREESLQRLARKTAGKAMKYRRNMMLEPMNAYERHVIHAALQDYDPSISTYSTGTEPNRRLVVAYGK